MKQMAWPPAGLWHHEEPQLNFGWNCAVNNLLVRNCLLIGRKRISVIAEVLSLCVPDAGSKIKKKKKQCSLESLPLWTTKSQLSISLSLQYYHFHLIQCAVIPKAIF